ncbi:MAG TPA: DMT family transporter [Planctomycetota bacterium]|jgi:drug/metabolite transporter (DMT)-like permease|nr:DMT family transporter [Planctomycetota bacterium]
MPPKIERGHVALAVVQVLFALFPVFGKVAFDSGAFTPFTMTVWRIAFGSVSLLAVALLVHGRRAIPRLADVPVLFLCSFLGVTANMILYLEGLTRSTATNAGLMMCLIPVFTFVIASAVRQETFHATRALGVVVALAGAAALRWNDDPDLAGAHALGNLLMVMNTLSYSIYLVVSRPLLKRIPPLALIAWVFVLALPFVPFLVRGAPLVPDAPARAWWALAFIVVFPTSVAYLLNAWALQRLRASTTAMYVYVQPLITGVVSRYWLGEKLTRGTLVAGSCIFAGIWLVARRPRADEPAPLEAGG